MRKIGRLRISDNMAGVLKSVAESTFKRPTSEQFKEQIEARLNDFRSYAKRAEELGISLAQYMSGDSIDHLNDAHYIKVPQSELERYSGGFVPHFSLEVGFDYATAVYERMDRFKFYISANQLGSGARGVEFIRQLAIKCKERRISLQFKTFDHNYDSCNLYTFHPDELRQVLEGLYPEFEDIFSDVPRVLQGALTEKIPSSRIAFVQEPAGRKPYSKSKIEYIGSHSNRMGELGKKLEEVVKLGGLTQEVYVQACAEIGVQPNEPWKLAV